MIRFFIVLIVLVGLATLARAQFVPPANTTDAYSRASITTIVSLQGSGLGGL